MLRLLLALPSQADHRVYVGGDGMNRPYALAAVQFTIYDPLRHIEYKQSHRCTCVCECVSLPAQCNGYPVSTRVQLVSGSRATLYVRRDFRRRRRRITWRTGYKCQEHAIVQVRIYKLTPGRCQC